MTARIVIVEDELAIREMIKLTLHRAGFSADEAGDGKSAEQMIRYTTPDLILLDWMLPDTSGLDLARKLKRDPQCRDIPIIMVTAKGEEEDKVRGLESGADDYITKPFSPRELVARIKAMLRRTAPAKAGEKLEIGTLMLDPQSHRVTAAGASVDLGPTEFRLLRFLMSNPERVFSRAQLLDNAWGTNVFVEERTVDVHIRRLRKALEPGGCDNVIQTVRGAGYRLSVSAPT